MSKVKVDFLNGKIFPKLFWYVLPIIATNFLQTFYNAADMMVVGLSDEVNAVGAVGATGVLVSLIVNLFIGFSVGANVVVARHIGEQDETKVQNAVHTSLLMALTFGTLGMAVGILITRPVLALLGSTGSLLELAVTYCYIYLVAVPFLSLTNYLVAIFRAKGDSKTPLVVLTVAGALNVALNSFFVLVLDMSVEGVAFATVLSNVFSFVVLLIKLRRDKDWTTFSFKRLKFDKKEMREIIRIGLPAGVEATLFSIAGLISQRSTMQVNNAFLQPGNEFQPIAAGTTAASSICGFVYAAMCSVTQGAVTFTSQNIGAKKPRRIKPIMYNCYLLTVMLGVLFGGVVFLLREPLLGFYGVVDGAAGSLEAIAYDAATTLLTCICLPYFLVGMMEVGGGVLRGLGKAMTTMGISLFWSCLFRCVWLLTVFPLTPTLTTIYIVYPLASFLTAATSFTAIQVLIKKC